MHTRSLLLVTILSLSALVPASAQLDQGIPALPGCAGDLAGAAGDPIHDAMCHLIAASEQDAAAGPDSDGDGRADYAVLTIELPAGGGDGSQPSSADVLVQMDYFDNSDGSSKPFGSSATETFVRTSNVMVYDQDGQATTLATSAAVRVVGQSASISSGSLQLSIGADGFTLAGPQDAFLDLDPGDGNMVHMGVELTVPDGGVFPDGQGFQLNNIWITSGDPRSGDTDNDGFSDTREVVVCQSNPVNAQATCDDPDADDVGGEDPNDDQLVPFDPDVDDDGVPDGEDNCPAKKNADQLNTDGDAQGDACDADDDNDGVNDGADAFPKDPDEWADADKDGLGDNEDPSDDGDSVPDDVDKCPGVATEENGDLDNDGVGDGCDSDKDGDGVDDAPASAGPVPVAGGDCDPNDPAIGGPESGNCALDDALETAGAALEAQVAKITGISDGAIAAAQAEAAKAQAEADGIIGTITGTEPPAAGETTFTTINTALFPECSDEPQPEFCSQDPFDQRDRRDTNSNGELDESNGQEDIVEERVAYYKLDHDGMFDIRIVQPGGGLGALQPDAVRIAGGDLDASDAHESILAFDVAGVAYCAYNHDGATHLAGGDSIEAACQATGTVHSDVDLEQDDGIRLSDGPSGETLLGVRFGATVYDAQLTVMGDSKTVGLLLGLEKGPDGWIVPAPGAENCPEGPGCTDGGSEPAPGQDLEQLVCDMDPEALASCASADPQADYSLDDGFVTIRIDLDGDGDDDAAQSVPTPLRLIAQVAPTVCTAAGQSPDCGDTGGLVGMVESTIHAVERELDDALSAMCGDASATECVGEQGAARLSEACGPGGAAGCDPDPSVVVSLLGDAAGLLGVGPGECAKPRPNVSVCNMDGSQFYVNVGPLVMTIP